jgi:hypothetical protein
LRLKPHPKRFGARGAKEFLTGLEHVADKDNAALPT